MVITRAVGPDGRTRSSWDLAPGTEYGENFMALSVPSDTVSATYWAACFGRAAPTFFYAPGTFPSTAPSDS